MSDAAGIGIVAEFEPGRPRIEREFAERLDRAVARGRDYLLSLQHQEGYWLGELEADTTLESDYIFFLHLVGRAEPDRLRKLANYIRARQLPDGGWSIYPDGPSELNATVKGWVALRLAGDAPDSPHLARAARCVRDLGGLERTNSFTRFYLALAGVIGWDMVPAIVPELMLLPSWFPINLYEASSWTRGIVVPLMILWARKPLWRLPVPLDIEPLFRNPSQRRAALEWGAKPISWRNVFLAVDRALKWRERFPRKLLRRRALEAAERWMREHLERSDGLAAIFPGIVNSIFALMAMGQGPEDPLTAREMKHLAEFEIAEGDTIRLQPCLSPLWDTCIAMVSLEEAGLGSNHPAILRAADWILNRQVLGPGDWQEKAKAAPGGWAFEFRNDFYPDVDDTAFVLMALRRVAHPDSDRLQHAIRRGLAWLVGMQNRNGGWGAFDKDNERRLLTQTPFADHNAMIDPATADVTARVLECLGLMGWPKTHEVIQRAYRFLQNDQTQEGAWYGRWGVNYVYGTSGVLRAFEAAGLAAGNPSRRGAEWLRSVQNPDGGFGESPASYDDPSLKGRGPSTASQTAWGLIGLLAAGATEDAATVRAAEYLLETQTSEGGWEEQQFTGTGFPSVFYLRYHLYRNSFPVYALARYRNRIAGTILPEGTQLLPHELTKNGA